MKGRPKSKNRKLFDPDVDTARLHQAVKRDLGSLMYESRAPGSVISHVLAHQGEDFLKKYCGKSHNKDELEEEAFRQFRQVNDHMGVTNKKLKRLFKVIPKTIADSRSTREKILLRARAAMHHVLSDFDEDEWFLECKNSSGTTVGVPFADTSPERKFRFPISTSMNAQCLFERYIAYDPKLWAAVKELNGGFPHLGGMFDVRTASRATTVDKTTNKRRFICVEPTLNMFLQQGLMVLLYRRMLDFGLDVETLPDKHKELAWLSSITGNYATIDFSSASDCVSIELLRWLLPAKWFGIIMLLRSNTTDIGGSFVGLNMISSMGNATTFPLESLVFWTIAVATVYTLEGHNDLFVSCEAKSKCSVFGDDCILPTSAADTFMSVCEDVGFIVNKEKSFYGSERFRESCGGDYLAGYPVRPFYLKAPPNRKDSSREPWLYVVFNSLIRKYILYFGELNYVYDRELFRLMSQLFVECKINIKLVPNHFPDDAGLKIGDDLERFCKHYELKLERIDKSDHGTYIFKYCRFRYRYGENRDDQLRYNMWLKRPRITEESLVLTKGKKVKWDRPNRKVGGYVVAKGRTCHWHLPVVNRGLRT